MFDRKSGFEIIDTNNLKSTQIKLIDIRTMLFNIQHYQHKKNADAVRKIFEFIIETENYNAEIPKLVSQYNNDGKDILEQLFQIAIRQENLNFFAKIDPQYITCFHAYEFRSRLYDQLMQNPELLKSQFVHFSLAFFIPPRLCINEEALSKDKKDIYIKFLLDSENFRDIARNASILSEICELYYADLTHEQKEIFGKNCRDCIDAFGDLWNHYYSREHSLNEIFNTATHGKVMFQQLCKPENCISLVTHNGETLQVPRILSSWVKTTDDMPNSNYFKIVDFFMLPKESAEHNILFEFLFAPGFVEKTIGRTLSNTIAVCEYYEQEEKREKIIETFIAHLAGPKLLCCWGSSDDKNQALIKKFISLLNKNQLKEINSRLLKPDTFKELIKLGGLSLVMLYMTDTSRFLDRLLEQENFLLFISGTSLNSNRFSDEGKKIRELDNLCSMCIQNNKKNKLLHRIMQNFSSVVTDIFILNALGKRFPDNKTLTQPTLKLARQQVRGDAYTYGAAFGMLSFLGENMENNESIAHNAELITPYLNKNDARNMALTCKGAANTAKEEVQRRGFSF